MPTDELSGERALVVMPAATHGQAVSLDWSQDDLKALKDTIAKDCDQAQFKVFVIACQRLGLDPFARQITPLVLNSKMTPQITIDGFRLIAERTRKYAGQLGPLWCGADGKWQEVWLADADPVACKVGVLRRDFDQPVWGVARTKAYKSGTPTWQKMPDVMIAKVAESLALRKAFPQELSGVYSDVEMDQARDEDRISSKPAPKSAVRSPDPDTDNIHFEVVDSTAKPAPAPPPARATFADLRLRALATKRINTVAQWEAFCGQHAGTHLSQRMDDAQKTKLREAVEELERGRGDFPEERADVDLSQIATPHVRP